MELSTVLSSFENITMDNCVEFLNKILVDIKEDSLSSRYKKKSLFTSTSKSFIKNEYEKGRVEDVFYQSFLIAIDCIIPDFVNNSYKLDKGKINKFLKEKCKNENFSTENIYWAKNLRDNWQIIKEELNNFNSRIPEFREISKMSMGVKGWKVLFLKAFEKDAKNIEVFPRTKKLLDECPCATAFFSILEPGTKIRPHVGYYQGIVRYHLALSVPQKWEDCYITVNNIKLHWHEGEDIMFDDMFLHYVENNTDEKRIVLFLDIIREFDDEIINTFNKIILKFTQYDNILSDTIDKVNKI